MRKRCYFIVLAFLGSLLMVTGLFVNARHRLQKNEAFERRFAPHILGRKQSIQLPYNSFYLAGADSSSIWLANHLKSTYLISVDRKNLDTGSVHIAYPDSLLAKPGWQWEFQAGAAFCFNYLSGELNWWPGGKLLQPSIPLRFTPIQQLIAISPNEVFIKTFDAGIGRRMIQSINLPNNKILNQFYPEQTTEGIHSTSGDLTYDPFSTQLIYVHHYWNRVQLLDNQLKSKAEAHTIDLQEKFNLVITKYGDPKTPTFKVGGNIVNKHIAAAGGTLLILSGQAANNQTLTQLQTLWTIDVYKSSNIDYLYSFYLPRQKGNSNLDFLFSGNQLFAMEGQTLTRYDLNILQNR